MPNNYFGFRLNASQLGYRTAQFGSQLLFICMYQVEMQKWAVIITTPEAGLSYIEAYRGTPHIEWWIGLPECPIRRGEHLARMAPFFWQLGSGEKNVAYPYYTVLDADGKEVEA